MAAGVGLAETLVEGIGIIGTPNGGVLSVQGVTGGTALATNITQWGGVAVTSATVGSDVLGTAPTAPFVLSYPILFNATTANGERARVADADGKPATGIPASGGMVFNGATWDRAREANADAVAVSTGIITSGLMAIDNATGNWNRLRTIATNDGVGAPSIPLATIPFNMIFNGATWTRAREATADLMAVTGITAAGNMLWNTVSAAFDRWQEPVGDGVTAVGHGSTQPFLWNGATYDRPRGNFGDHVVATGFQNVYPMVVDAFAGDNIRLRGTTLQGLRTTPRRTITTRAVSAANTAVTLTIAAGGVGLYHYIYAIKIRRIGTAAVAGGALLTYTSTQLNGYQHTVGNFYSILAYIPPDVQDSWAAPLRSDTANTAVTIVAPAAGATIQVEIEVQFFTDVDQA